MTPTPAPPDDLDRRFTDYFRHEMPEPFPKFQGTTAVPSSLSQTRRPFGSSRLTLAASAAGLLGLGLMLSSPNVRNQPTVKAPAAPGTNLLETSTADGAELLKKAGK